MLFCMIEWQNTHSKQISDNNIKYKVNMEWTNVISINVFPICCLLCATYLISIGVNPGWPGALVFISVVALFRKQ